MWFEDNTRVITMATDMWAVCVLTWFDLHGASVTAGLSFTVGHSQTEAVLSCHQVSQEQHGLMVRVIQNLLQETKKNVSIQKKNPSHFLQRRHGCIISPLQQDCCRLWSTGRPLPLCRQWSGIHPEKLFWWAEGRLDREEPGPLEAGPVLEGTTETTSADLKSFHRQGVKMYRIWFDCQWIWKVMWKCEDRSRIWGGKWSNQNRISIILYINIIIHHSIKLTFDSFLWSKMTVWGHNWATNTAVIRKKSSKKYLVSSWSCWNSGSCSVPHLLWRWQWPCHCSPASSRPSLSVWTRIGQPPDQSPWQLRCLRSRSSHQQDH